MVKKKTRKATYKYGKPETYKPRSHNEVLLRQIGSVFGIGLLLVSILMVLSLSSWHIDDPSLSFASGGEPENWMGEYGAIYADLSMQMLGLAGLALILPLFYWSMLLILQRNIYRFIRRLFFYVLAVLSLAAGLSMLPHIRLWPLNSGLGGIIGDQTASHVAFYATKYISNKEIYEIVFPLVFLLFSLLSMGIAGGVVWNNPPKVKINKNEYEYDDIEDEETEDYDLGEVPDGIIVDEEDLKAIYNKNKSKKKIRRKILPLLASKIKGLLTPRNEYYIEEAASLSEQEQLAVLDPTFPGGKLPTTAVRKKRKISNHNVANALLSREEAQNNFDLPYLGYLNAVSKKKRGVQFSDEFLRRNAHKLENVLEEFGVKGKIINAHPGPVVTLYELEPAPGIKSSRIIGLADDIARSMSALSVRVAVVPGRNVIGIELPNTERETVYLRTVLESTQYQESTASLALALGENIAGEPVVTDLAKMPHLLVAGTTGSGKSVGINTMILSLLYKLTPEQCRFIMVDPKMLELSVYEGIPHLLTPVVTDPKKAVVALKWAVREMEDRYRKMAKMGVRNIAGYNKRIKEMIKNNEPFTYVSQTGFDKETGKPIYETQNIELVEFPYIVIIIDEMADLMMVAGKEIEGAVQRLAQMARAAGLHVIMATQRPSVDVITGTIKANFPTRISFSVTSKIDSRTILGEQGAEQLLGQGDMLFMMGGGRIQRVHGPFVSDREVEEVVNHLKLQGMPDYKEDITTETEEDEFPDLTETSDNKPSDLYDQAVAIVLRDRKASTSYIQRRLSIGYNKAATLIERMESEGIISAANHVGKREILVPEN